MTLVKICSITNIADALAAVGAGADYLGFIGVPNTPRYVTPERYREIVAALPSGVEPVVVVRLAQDGLAYGARNVQYYDGDPSLLPADIRRIQVLRPRKADELSRLLAGVPDDAFAVLIDAFHPDKLGGAGEATDLAIASEAVRLSAVPVFLAGGLTPGTVAAAVAAAKPYAVDVSSGVEERPGRKDAAKVAAFIGAAKRAG